MSIDKAKATELRKPFPRESIGQLPKPFKSDAAKGDCRECGGYHGLPALHLDFVGHAAVTDRLLTVDPEWSWDFALHRADGTPVLDDGSGNLWITLTICGVTRKGVGDGKSAKERIGDAIRNAAMRFGVALDLWAKENLVEFAQAASRPVEASTGAQQREPEQSSPPKALTARTRGQLFALFGQKGVAEADQLSGMNHINDTAHTSRSQITEAEAQAAIKVLKTRPDAEVAS